MRIQFRSSTLRKGYSDLFRLICTYGKVVQFRSFQTKHVLMCKIHEQDTVSVLKHVLCSFITKSEFLHENVEYCNYKKY
jgi:hypothetical protein